MQLCGLKTRGESRARVHLQRLPREPAALRQPARRRFGGVLREMLHSSSTATPLALRGSHRPAAWLRPGALCAEEVDVVCRCPTPQKQRDRATTSGTRGRAGAAPGGRMPATAVADAQHAHADAPARRGASQERAPRLCRRGRSVRGRTVLLVRRCHDHRATLSDVAATLKPPAPGASGRPWREVRRPLSLGESLAAAASLDVIAAAPRHWGDCSHGCLPCVAPAKRGPRSVDHDGEGSTP